MKSGQIQDAGSVVHVRDGQGGPLTPLSCRFYRSKPTCAQWTFCADDGALLETAPTLLTGSLAAPAQGNGKYSGA